MSHPQNPEMHQLDKEDVIATTSIPIVQQDSANDIPDHGHETKEDISLDAQPGVQYMEAMATVWTRKSLYAAYAFMWLIYFLVLIEGTVIGALTPYVASAFNEHSLTPTVQVLAKIINGVLNLTLSKILDVWGRHVALVLTTIITVVGFVMLAGCHSFEQFAAADIFWQVGHAALLYTINILTADTSSLRSRGVMIAFTGSPSLITLWAAGAIATAYLNGPGWQWAFGTFALLTPVVVAPLITLVYLNISKAKKRGILPSTEGGRSILQSTIHW